MRREISIIIFSVSVAVGSLLDGDLELADGVKLVSTPVSNSLEDESRSFGKNTILYRMARFLQGHELHVKLPNLVAKDKMIQVLAESLKAVDETNNNNTVTGRGRGGGGGGGGGGLALLGVLYAKAIAAAGIGAIGLLALKALALAGVALLLSALVGVKKMSSHDEHDDHQVIYAGHHGHHRRRRNVDTPLPYMGWKEFQKTL